MKTQRVTGWVCYYNSRRYETVIEYTGVRRARTLERAALSGINGRGEDGEYTTTIKNRTLKVSFKATHTFSNQE